MATITYRFIFKPEEVAEEEISISQRHSGVAFLEIVACCADQVPHLKDRLAKKVHLKKTVCEKC